jgi:hypothetical protein
MENNVQSRQCSESTDKAKTNHCGQTGRITPDQTSKRVGLGLISEIKTAALKARI